MKKTFGLLIAAVCGTLTAAAGGPGKFQLNLHSKTNANYTFMFSYIGANGHVFEQINGKEGQAPVPVLRDLSKGSQIMFIHNKTFLVNTNEPLEVEMDVSQMRNMRPHALHNDRKFQLPNRIDSIFNTCSEAKSRAEMDGLLKVTDTWIAKEKKAAGLSVDELETVAVFEGICRMMAKRSMVRAHEEVAKTEGFSDWYFEGFDLTSPHFDRIGNAHLMSTIVSTWWFGRQAAEPGLEAEFMMVDLMRTAKSTVLRDEAAKLWIYGETRYKHWTPTIKEIYPVLKNGVSTEAARNYIDSLYNRYVVLDYGRPAPNFAAKNEKFKTVHLSDYKGKMVVIDVWAHWCTYCIAKLPRFREIAEKYKGKDDIVFLTIAWHTPGFEKLWMELAGKAGITGPNNLTVITRDDDKAAKALFEDGYRITQAPRYIVIDKNGNFLNAALSTALDEKVEQEIEDYYNQQAQ
ncbi:TlpA family protein disulfide reductase [Chitinophaga sp. NPDC101104]|uniref:TlpA family protein disulfide reductase n=1 Tax=Chitinophaga sp. NPDC101104 TaxID=3390561 RepID=UPI003D04F464